MLELSQNPIFLQDGILMRLFKLLQSELNFNYTLVPSPDGIYGSNNKGNWSGQIGLLQRKEIDISIMELTSTYERAQVGTSENSGCCTASSNINQLWACFLRLHMHNKTFKMVMIFGCSILQMEITGHL